MERTVVNGQLWARVLLREDDGREFEFECTCGEDGGIVISGQTNDLDYLEEKYTPPGFSGAVLELATGLPR